MLVIAALGALTASQWGSVVASAVASTPVVVGKATTFAANNGSNSTAIPNGTTTGDVLVSTIESYPFTKITCPAGWTKAWDAANGSTVRVAICVGVVANPVPASVNISVNPPTQVSIVTQAFSGVNPLHPLDLAASNAGLAPPAASAPAGDLLVLSEGSSNWQAVATAPRGATLGASVNDRGNSQAAQATEPFPTGGATPVVPWTLVPGSPVAVSGVIALASGSGGTSVPSKSAQAITFTSTPPSNPPVGSTYLLGAAGGGSGNPVVFSLDPASTGCTLSGAVVTFSVVGTCVVDANQSGNAQYLAAPQVSQAISVSASTPDPPSPPPPVSGGAPASAGPQVCGNSSLLNGPSSPPTGAVSVAAGDDSGLTLNAPNTTYWFAPGVHTLGSGPFSQIIPSNGDTYLGGPGAVINDQYVNDFAFTQHAQGVTIRYLTIENFIAADGQGVVNHDSGPGWTVENDTIEGTQLGAGLMLGPNSVTTNDCLTNNGEYGFDGYAASGDSNVTLTDNEISYNDTYNYDQPGGISCGCAGGGKFWEIYGATVTGNYVHNNKDVGLWIDTDNTGFNIANNYIANNSAEGIMYEISYNANIVDNTLIDNGWGKGPTNPGFPTGAIYVSESGGDSRVPGAYSGQFNIQGNVFTDNWGGVVLWENSNRFCSGSGDNACTLVDPSVYSIASCGTHLSASAPGGNPDYFDNCRWKTQNAMVSNNTFHFQPADIGPSCTVADSCGFNALFSEYGSDAPYAAWVVPNNISNNQNNHFSKNTYVGPWHFDGFNQGETVTFAQWTSGFNDINGSGDHFGAQDVSSVISP